MEKLGHEIVANKIDFNNFISYKLIKMKEIEKILGMSRSQIDKLCKTDPTFPEKINFGESRQSMVRFNYYDVLTYIESKRCKVDSDFYQENNKVRLS